MGATARRRIVRLLAAASVVVAGAGALDALQGLPAGAAPKGAEVHAANVHGRGTVLVDGSGHTLYVFSPDKGRGPTCHGACAAIWPPLTTTGKPSAGHGVAASHLATVAGPNGTRQVTFDHWPLYTFVQDTAAGEATGQGIVSFGGKWSTISPSGSAFNVTSTTKHTSEPRTSGSKGTSGSPGYSGSSGSSGSGWGS